MLGSVSVLSAMGGLVGGSVQTPTGRSATSTDAIGAVRHGLMPNAVTAARTAKTTHAHSVGLKPAVTPAGLPR